MGEDSILWKMLEKEMLRGDTLSAVDSLSQPVASAEAIFGNLSTLVHNTGNISVIGNTISFTDNLFFQLLAAAIFVSYCGLIFFYNSHALALLKSMKSKLFCDSLQEDQNYLFTQFMNLINITGIFALGMTGAKFAEILGMSAAISSSGAPEWIFSLFCPALIVMIAFVYLFRMVIPRLIGGITLNQNFTNRLVYMRKMISATGVVIITPFLLLFIINDSSATLTISYMVVLLLVIWCIYATYKTLQFFIEQNVSILHWFLYLCGVEIFPVSIFILIALRYA